MSLESKGYIANDDDVSALTRSVLSGIAAAESGRTSYLRALIATTQHALGARPRVRPGRPAKLDTEDIKAQIAALESTHDNFYAAVIKVASEDGSKGVALNRRTNFARTALYAIRTWVRAGNDITSLAPARVSKGALKVIGRKLVQPPSPRRLKSRVEKDSKRVMASILALVEADKLAARAEILTLIGQLQHELDEMPAERRHRGRPALHHDTHAGAQ